MFARMSAQVKTVECQRIATTVGGHVYVRDVDVSIVRGSELARSPGMLSMEVVRNPGPDFSAHTLGSGVDRSGGRQGSKRGVGRTVSRKTAVALTPQEVAEGSQGSDKVRQVRVVESDGARADDVVGDDSEAGGGRHVRVRFASQELALAAIEASTDCDPFESCIACNDLEYAHRGW